MLSEDGEQGILMTTPNAAFPVIICCLSRSTTGVMQCCLSFSCAHAGLCWPDRTPHPACWEVKAVQVIARLTSHGVALRLGQPPVSKGLAGAETTWLLQT